MIPFNDIDNAKHIVIKTDADSFANANVLYSYILSKHKKVSLVITQEIDAKFSFLPWYAKQRENTPASADLVIQAQPDTVALFGLLKKNSVVINQKMATALFAGLLKSTEGFLNADGTAFAIASGLIEQKADYFTCKEFLQKREPLALFRLKSLMYKKMRQSENAQIMNMYISDEDLKSSGATGKDVEKVLKEVLKIVHVKEVRLYKSDDKNKILKSIKEV